MRRLASLLLVAASFGLGSRAVAIDLTGTWVTMTRDASAKCRYFNDDAWQPTRDGNLGTLYVKQVGTDLYVEIDKGSVDAYDNKFKGVVVAASDDPEKGAGSATACKIDGEYYHGALSIWKAQADPTRGVMTVEFIGTNVGAPLRCKVKLERTDAADPGVTTTCP